MFVIESAAPGQVDLRHQLHRKRRIQIQDDEIADDSLENATLGESEDETDHEYQGKVVLRGRKERRKIDEVEQDFVVKRIVEENVSPTKRRYVLNIVISVDIYSQLKC